jgi:2-iminoacetate synthase ThiH
MTAVIESSREMKLIEGEDFYREGAFVVFTAAYHLRRGRCCESRCRHCPFGSAKEGREDARDEADEKTAR